MEELFVYALLCSIGFDEFLDFKNTLDDLFLLEPTNEKLLDLEYRNDKDAILHTLHLMKEDEIDIETFGKNLMNALRLLYHESHISEFSRKMYELWKRLPGEFDSQEPFHAFSYAEDCLSYGDEKQCRKLLECAFNYYGHD